MLVGEARLNTFGAQNQVKDLWKFRSNLFPLNILPSRLNESEISFWDLTRGGPGAWSNPSWMHAALFTRHISAVFLLRRKKGALFPIFEVSEVIRSLLFKEAAKCVSSDHDRKKGTKNCQAGRLGQVVKVPA
jgi:hypothetical protein